MVEQRDTSGTKRTNDPILNVEDLKGNSALGVLQQIEEATCEKQSATTPPDPEGSSNQPRLPATRRGQKKIRLDGSTYIGLSPLQGEERTRFEGSVMRHAIALGQAAQRFEGSVMRHAIALGQAAQEVAIGRFEGKNVVVGDEICHYGGNYGGPVSPVDMGDVTQLNSTSLFPSLTGDMGDVTEYLNIPSYANGTTSKGKEIITDENMYINGSPDPWASGLPSAVSEEIGPALQVDPTPTAFSCEDKVVDSDTSRPTIWLSDKGYCLGYRSQTSGNAGFSATDFGAGNASFTAMDHLQGDNFRSSQNYIGPDENMSRWSRDTVVSDSSSASADTLN